MRWLLALLLLMLPLAALAQQPLYDPQPLQFRDDAEERRFHDWPRSCAACSARTSRWPIRTRRSPGTCAARCCS